MATYFLNTPLGMLYAVEPNPINGHPIFRFGFDVRHAMPFTSFKRADNAGRDWAETRSRLGQNHYVVLSNQA